MFLKTATIPTYYGISIAIPRYIDPMVVNGQRITHYISGIPINVETNIINTITPKEYIRDTFQNFQALKRNSYVVR